MTQEFEDLYDPESYSSKSRFLELELCKIRRQLDSIKGNEYSDRVLDEYQRCLFLLFNNMEAKILASIESNEPLGYYLAEFSFITSSIQFLEDSVFNILPYETVYCLRKALRDWVEEDLIIVTSLNKTDNYAFNPKLSYRMDDFFTTVKSDFGVEFTSRLLQISLPKQDVTDYFFSVVLYHELAHFIDYEKEITEGIMEMKFPELEGRERQKKLNHYREHFADLFSAQYIHQAFIYYLDLRAANDGENFTHPATYDRIEVVNAFLEEEDNEISGHIQVAVENVTKQKLSIRHELIEEKYQDFYDYLPPVIENDAQLHGLFIAGWDIWLNHKEKFPEKNPTKIYAYLNNLIEKSISNYMVTSKWNANVSEQDGN